jgi:hypothetical protein
MANIVPYEFATTQWARPVLAITQWQEEVDQLTPLPNAASMTRIAGTNTVTIMMPMDASQMIVKTGYGGSP